MFIKNIIKSAWRWATFHFGGEILLVTKQNVAYGHINLCFSEVLYLYHLLLLGASLGSLFQGECVGNNFSVEGRHHQRLLYYFRMQLI